MSLELLQMPGASDPAGVQSKGPVPVERLIGEMDGRP